MTDRYSSLTVILDHDIRDDDAEPLLQAIRMLKGVARVEPHVSDGMLGELTVRTRLAKEITEDLQTLQKKLWRV